MRRVLLLALIWGWSFLFIKVAVQGMSPATVAGGRVFLGMLVVLAALRLRGTRLPKDRRAWRHFAFMAVIHSAVPFTLLAWGEQRTTSALASVLNASTGLFAALAGAVFLGERLKIGQRFGMALGFAGVAVASGLGLSDIATSSITGAGAAVAAAACYGLGFAYAERNLKGIPSLVAAGGQLVVATAVMAPFALVTTLREGISLTPTRVISIVLLGAVGTGYAYLLNYRSIAEMGSTRAALVTYFVVVVAVTVGVVFLDEPFEFGLVLGAVLVIVGVLLVQERLRRFRPAPVVTLLALFVLLLTGSCGSGRGDAPGPADDVGCSPMVEERLDPRSGFHVLPGTPPPTYETDQPTSGPHASSGTVPTGRLADPLPPPLQVQLLERGEVLLHHRDLDGDELRALEGLAGEGVTVVPAPTAPDRVVATAWGHKMLCNGVDVDELRRFVADRKGKNLPAH